MALQTINIGASANDGSGDPLRTAMDKINDNFLAVSAGTFNVKDPAYGAVGNGVTDDTAAINAALDACRAALSSAIIPTGGGVTATLEIPYGIYLITDSLDFTGLKGTNWLVNCNGSKILAKCTGKPVIDILHSAGYTIRDLTIWGHATNTPTYGIQQGRAVAGDDGSSANCLLENVYIDGYFDRTCLYNFAGEQTNYINCWFTNRKNTSTSFCLIMDGSNEEDISSEFEPVTLATSTAQAFSQQLFLGCTFRKGGVSSPITGSPILYMGGGGMSAHKFSRCYGVSTDSPIIDSYKWRGCSNMELDIHAETTGATMYLRIDNDGADVTRLPNLILRDAAAFLNTCVIDATGAGANRQIFMDKCLIEVGVSGSTIPLFGSNAAADRKLVSGDILWAKEAALDLSGCYFDGDIYTNNVATITDTVGSYRIHRRPVTSAERIEKFKGQMRVMGTAEGTDISNYIDLIGAATGNSPMISGGGSDAAAGLLVRGGTGVASPLTFRSTSGVGTTGADIIFQAGNNGATEIARFFNNGSISIGKATVESPLTVYRDNTSTTPLFTVEQDGTGDAQIQLLFTGTKSYVFGLDNSDNDKFKIEDGNNGFSDRIFELDTNGNCVIKGSLIVDPQVVTGAGALTLGKTYHSLSNSSGSSYAVTLAAPTSAEYGIIKTIEMIVGDGTNTVTLSLANCDGGTAATTCTWNAAAKKLVVQGGATKWTILKQQGVTLT